MLKVAPRLIVIEKLVAAGKSPRKRTPGEPATPCKASDHHCYPGKPRRGIAEAAFTS